jgi:hypothetical protein
VNWEEEVRRLLGESEVPAPKPPPMPTPPLLVPQVPAPLPMAPVRPLPRLASEAETVHAPKAIQKAFITQDKASRLDQEVEARMRTVTGKMGTMAESTTAHERARQLEGEVTSRLQKVAEEPVAPTYAVHRTRLSPEAKQVLQMLRTPRSARQAIVASIILQSPKGLE